MFIIWLVIFVILLLMEAASFNLITIWLALGALIASITAIYIDNVTLQLGVFVIVSLISLLLTRPLVKKLNNKKPENFNLDRIIGKIGIVTEDINNIDSGEVKVDGKRWGAYSKKKIIKGSEVEILSIKGIKLEVEKLEDN